MGFRHRLEYASVQTLRRSCRIMPRAVMLRAADLLGAAWYRLDRRRRARALDHLELAFGEAMPPAERRRVARRSLQYLARAVCDALDLDRWDLPRAENLVTWEGWEHIEAAHASGRGVLLFSGHMGFWELVPHLQALRGLPQHLVVRSLNNRLLDGLLNDLRRSSGNQVLSKRQAVRPILRALRRGEGVSIVIDQNLRSGERIFVEFFGRLAATTPSLALLALRTNAVVLPVFCLPREDGGWKIRYLPPVDQPATEDRRRAVWEMTQRCTRIIEDMVRRHPEAWLWIHRRWRTRPGPDEKVRPWEESPTHRAAAGL